MSGIAYVVLATGAALLFQIVLFVTPVHAQINRDAYQTSNIDDVMAEYRLQVAPEDTVGDAAKLIKPSSKYRFRLKATGRIRDASPDAVDVLRALGFRYTNLIEFLKEYTHEIEVIHREKSMWLMWQRGLVVPFLAERRSGGSIDVYAVLAGNRGQEPLLLVTAYESIP